MQVQINLDTPFEYDVGQPVTPLQYKGDVIVATDPGKQNMAMVIGTTFGTRLCILQFRAPGSANDNSDYCRQFHTFLTEFLVNCNVVCFGIEQAISKKGMNFHRSSMVLTEIRANLIQLSYDLTGSKAMEVNNWSWKYAILPDGMRSQSEKGSARYLSSLYQSYGNADVTDAVCIYMFVVQKLGRSGDIIAVKEAEAPLANYKLFVMPFAPKQARRFLYDPKFTLVENCAYYTNRTWERGAVQIPTDWLTLDDIYTYAGGFSARSDCRQAWVVVVRS